MIHPAYLAGVIDSDGSLSITKNHRKRNKVNYSGRFQLTWTKSEKSERTIGLLIKQYGGSVCETTIKGGLTKQPVIKYCLCSGRLDTMLTQVRKFLELKQKQCDNLLLLQLLVDGGQGRLRSPEVAEAMEALYLNNRNLNSKNGKGKAIMVPLNGDGK